MLRMQETEPALLTRAELPPARRALLLAVLSLAACATFWPMLRGEFVYDDLWLVAQNPSLNSFGDLLSSLGGSHWDFMDARSAQSVGHWRPLTMLSLYVGSMLGHGAPVGFHALSLVLHLIAIALVFELTRRIARDTTIAFFVALLFALHPVQVEPVSWISSINDPLQAVFSLATMLCFFAWRERGSPGLPLASAAWFLCALLAKENALAVPPLIAAIDLGRAGGTSTSGSWRARFQPFVRPYAMVFAAFALYYLARVVVFSDGLAGFDRFTGHLGLTAGREASLRVEFFGGALGLLGWPRQLNLFREARPEIAWSDANLWLAVLAIALFLMAVAWAWRRRESAILTGLLIIPAALAPAILRIEALGRFPLSERYLYVSIFGFSLAAVVLAAKLSELVSLRRVALLAFLLVAAVFAWHSRQRTTIWQNERTLFAKSFDDNPKSPYVAWGLGRVMLEDYRYSEQIEFLQQARAAFEHSQELGLKREDGTRDPEVLVTDEDRLQANMGLGWCFFFAALRGFDETTLEEALAIFEKTLSYFPNSYEAMTACGVVLMSQDNLAAAEARFNAALALNPKNLEAWYYLGKLGLGKKDLPAARTAFERALELKQDDPATLPLYAGVLAEQGDYAGAQRALDRAFELAPEDPQVLLQLGLVAAKNNQGGPALAWFDRLLKIAPSYGPAHLQKGKVLLTMGQFQRAVPELQRACELSPRDFEAHYTLGVFLASQAMGKEALPYLERALELEPTNALADELRSQIESLRAQ